MIVAIGLPLTGWSSATEKSYRTLLSMVGLSFTFSMTAPSSTAVSPYTLDRIAVS